MRMVLDQVKKIEKNPKRVITINNSTAYSYMIYFLARWYYLSLELLHAGGHQYVFADLKNNE